jgi:predicted unusual protein kinase regulating ubiquinone biosynthesis (AarF/ABC1/UbiB family)
LPRKDSIPSNRLLRTMRLGTRAGLEGARFAGAKAGGALRSGDRQQERMEELAGESADRMVDTLGAMKGVAMKMGQLASFIDSEFLPDEYRELYQRKLGALRTSAPSMPWDRVRKVLDEEYDEPCEDIFEEIEPEAFAAASIGQVHRAVLPDGRRVAVKVQYPGIDTALRADLSNAGMLLRLAKAVAPGLDARAAADELRERVLEELDYEYEAQSQRSFARAYRGHPFIHVPDVVTRLSRSRVLVSEYVEGTGFEEVKRLEQDERDRFGEIVFRFYLGSIYQLQHFNADAHPGNYLLMDDGRVAFLDFGMTKRLDIEQIRLEEEVVKARIDGDAERLRQKLHELGFLRNPKRVDAERLMHHVDAVGGWYWHDTERPITPEYVMSVITAISDPRSDFYALMRRENVPANELMGRRMEIGVLAVLGQLRAQRNWHRIAREWWFGDEPATELGRAEHDFWESRGGTPRSRG